jgi:hypothetical protein
MFKGYEAFDYANIPTSWCSIVPYWLATCWTPSVNICGWLAMPRTRKPLIAVFKCLIGVLSTSIWRRRQKHRATTLEEYEIWPGAPLLWDLPGIFYFCYDDKGWKMKEHPQQWNDLQKLCLKFVFLSRFFFSWTWLVGEKNPISKSRTKLQRGLWALNSFYKLSLKKEMST